MAPTTMKYMKQLTVVDLSPTRNNTFQAIFLRTAITNETKVPTAAASVTVQMPEYSVPKTLTITNNIAQQGFKEPHRSFQVTSGSLGA